MKRKVRVFHDAAAIRQAEGHVIESDVRLRRGPDFDPRRLVPEDLRTRNGFLEQGQAIEHGFKAGERSIVGDEESERRLDSAKRARGLRHDAERNASGKIEGSREDEGNDR